MSFREKSAWAMGSVMIVTGMLLAYLVMQMPVDAAPLYLLVPLIPYVMTVILLSIITQALLGIWSPRAANQPADERERIAIDRAGHWSGYVLGFAVVSGAIHYVAYGSGNQLFLWVIGGMIASQIAEYAFQVFLFRRGM